MAYQIVICEKCAENQAQVARVVQRVLAEKNWGRYIQVSISALEEQALWPPSVFSSHLYLLSLRTEGAAALGREICRKNQWAPLLFYGRREDAEPLNGWLGARPVAFWDMEQGEEELIKILQEQLSLPQLAQSVLPVDTRTQRLYLPQRDILSVSTERAHYVDICYQKAGSDAFCHVTQRATVDQMEQYLNQSGFQRIHKSVIVGICHIRRFDKRNHLIELKNGEIFSISDRYYGHVREKLCFFDT